MASLRGLRPMLRAMEAIRRRVDDATETATTIGGHVVEAHIKRLLSLTSHQHGTPTPSAPGEPPSLITGNLRRSIRISPTTGGDRKKITVGPTAVYGRIQELGGYAGNGAYLPPRPYIRPGYRAAERELRRLYRDRWRRAITG